MHTYLHRYYYDPLPVWDVLSLYFLYFFKKKSIIRENFNVTMMTVVWYNKYLYCACTIRERDQSNHSAAKRQTTRSMTAFRILLRGRLLQLSTEVRLNGYCTRRTSAICAHNNDTISTIFFIGVIISLILHSCF
jgi:hypothetical protein